MSEPSAKELQRDLAQAVTMVRERLGVIAPGAPPEVVPEGSASMLVAFVIGAFVRTSPPPASVVEAMPSPTSPQKVTLRQRTEGLHVGMSYDQIDAADFGECPADVERDGRGPCDCLACEIIGSLKCACGELFVDHVRAASATCPGFSLASWLTAIKALTWDALRVGMTKRDIDRIDLGTCVDPNNPRCACRVCTRIGSMKCSCGVPYLDHPVEHCKGFLLASWEPDEPIQQYVDAFCVAIAKASASEDFRAIARQALGTLYDEQVGARALRALRLTNGQWKLLVAACDTEEVSLKGSTFADAVSLDQLGLGHVTTAQLARRRFYVNPAGRARVSRGRELLHPPTPPMSSTP